MSENNRGHSHKSRSHSKGDPSAAAAKSKKPPKKEETASAVSNFENWLKVVLINQLADERSSVVEFNALDGADSGKWVRAKVVKYMACGELQATHTHTHTHSHSLTLTHLEYISNHGFERQFRLPQLFSPLLFGQLRCFSRWGCARVCLKMLAIDGKGCCYFFV